MNDHIKNLETEILSDNWYTLKKITFDYLKKDGTWQSQQREAYDRGNGATILLYNKETQHVILTRQFRMPTYVNGNESGMMIEACAGLLDNDNPEDCIRKETEEETGYKLSEVKKIFEAYMSPGSVTEILYFFVAAYTKEMKENEGGGADETEELEVLELPFEEAISMMHNGEIKDAKTIMLLQYAQINQPDGLIAFLTASESANKVLNRASINGCGNGVSGLVVAIKTVYIPAFRPNCMSDNLLPAIRLLEKSMSGNCSFACKAMPWFGLRFGLLSSRSVQKNILIDTSATYCRPGISHIEVNIIKIVQRHQAFPTPF